MNRDQFLQGVKKLTVGKHLPTAKYIHVSALLELPDTLREFVGAHEPSMDWNILKLSRREFRCSFLFYPDFDTYPYPLLAKGVTVDFKNGNRASTDFSKRDNPPILHRRETFLSYKDIRRSEFEKFTLEGEKLGAYSDIRNIGTLIGWQSTLNTLDLNLDTDGHIYKNN